MKGWKAAFALRITRANSFLNTNLHLWMEWGRFLKMISLRKIQMAQYIVMIISMKKGWLIWVLTPSKSSRCHWSLVCKHLEWTNKPGQKDSEKEGEGDLPQHSAYKTHNYSLEDAYFAFWGLIWCSNDPSTLARKRTFFYFGKPISIAIYKPWAQNDDPQDTYKPFSKRKRWNPKHRTIHH